MAGIAERNGSMAGQPKVRFFSARADTKKLIKKRYRSVNTT